MNDFLQYISIDPEIRFGKPCIKNTRIAVLDILQWLASGMSFQEILIDFPALREEQIRAIQSEMAIKNGQYITLEKLEDEMKNW